MFVCYNYFMNNNSNPTTNQALDELTKQLEEELGKENNGQAINLNNSEEDKADEILELEKDINELQALSKSNDFDKLGVLPMYVILFS